MIYDIWYLIWYHLQLSNYQIYWLFLLPPLIDIITTSMVLNMQMKISLVFYRALTTILFQPLRCIRTWTINPNPFLINEVTHSHRIAIHSWMIIDWLIAVWKELDSFYTFMFCYIQKLRNIWTQIPLQRGNRSSSSHPNIRLGMTILLPQKFDISS